MNRRVVQILLSIIARNRRVVQILLSIITGSIGVAFGLYFGRFVSVALAFPFASSRQALNLVTTISWWASIGLSGGLGLAFTAINNRRARFVVGTLLSFALSGMLAAVVSAAGEANRDLTLSSLAIPVAGALSGLLVGLLAGLKARALTMLIVGGLAMAIAAPHIGSFIPPSDILALLLPGALIGMALAVLSPVRDVERA